MIDQAIKDLSGYQYAEKVLAGDIVSCQYVQQACQRFMDDLARDELELRLDKITRAVEFFADLKHGKGKHRNNPFILMPWQAFIITNIYGFYYKGTDRRRFTESYIEVARKNGKTALASGLCLLHLSYDGDSEAEVLQVANSKDQAKIAHRMTHGFIKRLDPDEQLFRRYRAEIHYKPDDGLLLVLASDDSKLDGYDCNFGLIDEYHAAQNSRVRDVIKSSQGQRENPHICTVTTAGFEKEFPCYELRTVCTEVLSGAKEDDNLFTIIFTIDEGDDWKDPLVWSKANPNLGITVNKDWLAHQVKTAVNNPSDEVGVKTKNLNIWTDTQETWIPEKYILESTEKDQSNPRDMELFIGVDLASNQDLTAVAYWWKIEGRNKARVDYYLPAESLQTRPDKEIYRSWYRAGLLKLTAGNVTDYEYILKDILDHHRDNFIAKIAYDTYNATQWAINATNENLPLEPFSQSIGNFNKPTREFERLILSGMVDLEDNAITRYCLRNVQLRMDHNGNVKPDKKQNKKKIDGVTALLQAMAMHVEYAGAYMGSIF